MRMLVEARENEVRIAVRSSRRGGKTINGELLNRFRSGREWKGDTNRQNMGTNPKIKEVRRGCQRFVGERTGHLKEPSDRRLQLPTSWGVSPLRSAPTCWRFGRPGTSKSGQKKRVVTKKSSEQEKRRQVAALQRRWYTRGSFRRLNSKLWLSLSLD